MSEPALFNTSPPLRRVREGAVIAGVCGGLARWMGWDPTIVRLFYILVSVASAAFPGVIVYILLWLIMPRD
jgi:phage shock protein PspC (stress-responsive transcriptional regulator)